MFLEQMFMSAYLLPQSQGLDLKCMRFFNDNHDREDRGQKILYYFGNPKNYSLLWKEPEGSNVQVQFMDVELSFPGLSSNKNTKKP